jgi:hypothetical protein
MHQHFGKRKALAIRRKTARKITYGLLPVLQKANWVAKRGPAGIKVKRIRKKSDLERELAVFIYVRTCETLGIERLTAIPRSGDNHNLGATSQEQESFQHRGAMRKEKMIPASFHEFWDEHGNVALRVLTREFLQIFEKGPEKLAVFGLAYDEPRWRTVEQPDGFFDQFAPNFPEIIGIELFAENLKDVDFRRH